MKRLPSITSMSVAHVKQDRCAFPSVESLEDLPLAFVAMTAAIDDSVTFD